MTAQKIQEMIDDVLSHAQKNYEAGGWDYVVECWDREDIGEEIERGNCQNAEEAIQFIAQLVGIWEERRVEVQALSGELEYYGLEERDGKIIRKNSAESS